MDYVSFASRISFFEFLQDEFKEPHFNTDDYRKEIDILKATVTIDYLTKVLESNPKIIDIFEELLQLKRFTNTQYINFCFDVNVLNNGEESLLLKYILNSVFKFENGEPNENFSDIYADICGEGSPTHEEVIFFTKRAIVQYVGRVLKKREILHHHIVNSIGCRLRIAKYLIENLNADDLVPSVNLERFLKQKRHPVDTKGLHGKFGNIKIAKILEKSGFKDITSSVSSPVLSVESTVVDGFDFKGFAYVREKAVEGIRKRKDRKPKKFDYILLKNGLPRILIETNFYSTAGTKIGINQGEYTDLNEDIKDFNKNQSADLKFIWITDGNYWLSKDGEGRFINLKGNFFTGEFELLNYKMFQEALPKLQKTFL